MFEAGIEDNTSLHIVVIVPAISVPQHQHKTNSIATSTITHCHTNQNAIHLELPISFTCNTGIWEVSCIVLWITSTKYELSTFFSRWITVQIEWENWLRNQSLLHYVLENWQHTIHWNWWICHTKNAIKLGGNKCDSRLRDGFSKCLICHLPKSQCVQCTLYTHGCMVLLHYQQQCSHCINTNLFCYAWMQMCNGLPQESQFHWTAMVRQRLSVQIIGISSKWFCILLYYAASLIVMCTCSACTSRAYMSQWIDILSDRLC